MDISELIQKAEEGSLGAMSILVRYYGEEEHRDFSEQEKWADKLADAGDPYGNLVSMYCHSVGGTIMLNMGILDGCERERKITYDRATYLLRAHSAQAIEMSKEQMASIVEEKAAASYGIAMAKYYQQQEGRENCKEIISYAKEEKSTRSYALQGVCEMNIDNYVEAYHHFDQVFKDSKYASTEKNTVDEGIYADALHGLSIIYRIGLPGTVDQNLNKAVEVLTFALQHIRDTDYQNIIQSELNRYQKKLFGGYKYI